MKMAWVASARGVCRVHNQTHQFLGFLVCSTRAEAMTQAVHNFMAATAGDCHVIINEVIAEIVPSEVVIVAASELDDA